MSPVKTSALKHTRSALYFSFPWLWNKEKVTEFCDRCYHIFMVTLRSFTTVSVYISISRQPIRDGPSHVCPGPCHVPAVVPDLWTLMSRFCSGHRWGLFRAASPPWQGSPPSDSTFFPSSSSSVAGVNQQRLRCLWSKSCAVCCWFISWVKPRKPKENGRVSETPFPWENCDRTSKVSIQVCNC